MNELQIKGIAAKSAARVLAVASTELKNNALIAISDSLKNNTDFIIDENSKDIENAKNNGIRTSMIDRLMLDKMRILDMSEGIRQLVALPDPVGEVINGCVRPNGLNIIKRRVPIGVIGIIYEARPNVTVDAAALCLKSGNVAFLRGGSEAKLSNIALVKLMNEALQACGLPNGCINLVEDVSRERVNEMMKLNEYIDVLIPRGGAGLIKTVVENSTVPVIETGSGICHTYISRFANLDMAENIAVNAKISRPSVCNSMETLLIDKEISQVFLPRIVKSMSNVEIRGCEKCLQICPEIIPATQKDWSTEYNDFILSVKIVDGISEAISHISEYGTKHSEAIVTDNYEEGIRFTSEVDAAAVYINASTRFTDGSEFGLGAEIGISTQKIHARGPMGLKELTTVKYIILGNGQIRK